MNILLRALAGAIMGATLSTLGCSPSNWQFWAASVALVVGIRAGAVK